MLSSSVLYRLLYYLKFKRLFMIIKNRITEKRKAAFFFFLSLNSATVFSNLRTSLELRRNKKPKKIGVSYVLCTITEQSLCAMEKNFRQDQTLIKEFKLSEASWETKQTTRQLCRLPAARGGHGSLLDLPNLRNEDDNIPSTANRTL